MHVAAKDAVAFSELAGEFREHARDLGTVVAKPGKTQLVEHVHVLGLPLLGRTHASVGKGLVYVAPMLGLRLPASGGPDDAGSLQLVAGGMEPEAYRCCQIMEQILRSCNAGWDSLVRLTVFVPDLTSEKLEAIERVIDLFSGEQECAPITKTAVGCSCLRMSAAIQMEGVALLAASEARPLLPPPPGLERMLDSPPLGPEPSPEGMPRQVSDALSEIEEGGGLASARTQRGAWLVAEALAGCAHPGSSPSVERAHEPAQEPAQEPAPERAPREAEATFMGLVGQMSAVWITALPLSEVQGRKLRFQRQHDTFRQVEMLMNRSYRTFRLDPGAFVCTRLPQQQLGYSAAHPWPAVWSYTFDVAVTRTQNSFVNVGLVEWVTQMVPPNPSDVPAIEPTLAQLVGASSRAGADAWQHVSESPRQVMLGCRKGVKWYGGGSWEHLFKDDICEGTQLQFLCDFYMDQRGAIRRTRLWLLPSSVLFRKRGWQPVKLGKPLCEWEAPPAGAGAAPRSCSLWVPAVTLFNQEDAVVASWRRGAGAAP